MEHFFYVGTNPTTGKLPHSGSSGALIRAFQACVGAALLLSPGLWASGAVEARELEVIRKIPHTGYSEGLDFKGGFLWHALPKALLKIDPKDGSVLSRYAPATDYSESLTWFQGSLWNVSFSDNGIYKGTLEAEKIQFKKVGEVPETHAWGLTHNGKSLIVTGNYSNKLYFLDPKTTKVLRSIEVPVTDLEDLAWDGKGIWTSSFTQLRGQIFRVNPQTGEVSRPFLLEGGEACPVIDGMAFDGKALWVTGKNCTSIYQVKIPPESQLKPVKRELVTTPKR